MQKTFKTINIPKLPVFTTEEGIKSITNNLEQIKDWKSIIDLIPKFYLNKNMKKSGIAGIFAASLELVKDGAVQMLQKELFKEILIKKKNYEESKDKNNIISFPSNVSKLERQIEAILFAASEPLDIETIEKRVQTTVNVTKILEKLKQNYK